MSRRRRWRRSSGAEADGAARVDGAEDRGETGAKPAEVGDAFYFVGNAPAAHSGDEDRDDAFLPPLSACAAGRVSRGAS